MIQQPPRKPPGAETRFRDDMQEEQDSGTETSPLEQLQPDTDAEFTASGEIPKETETTETYQPRTQRARTPSRGRAARASAKAAPGRAKAAKAKTKRAQAKTTRAAAKSARPKSAQAKTRGRPKAAPKRTSKTQAKAKGRAKTTRRPKATRKTTRRGRR